jgi:tRNA-2-methylthio-N6-dimethylallyladenosine synthase
MAFTSDFIVGYPGETEEDFRATLAIVGEVGYAGAFSFKYSPRPGTPAAERDDQVDEAVKVERLARLQAEIDRHQAAFNARCVGRTLEVLLEKPGRLPGQLVGRSPYLQPVHVMASRALIGEVVAVAVSATGANSLFGACRPAAPERIAMPEPASLET